MFVYYGSGSKKQLFDITYKLFINVIYLVERKRVHELTSVLSAYKRRGST